jgi:hypothetical protein
MAIPFAPVIIAAEHSTLLSQSYISSHSASGLVLLSPPSSTAVATKGTADSLPEFTFEPHFPVLVVAPDSQAKHFASQNRLVRDYGDKGVGRGGKGVSFETVPNVYSEQTRTAIERWMDRCGF